MTTETPVTGDVSYAPRIDIATPWTEIRRFAAGLRCVTAMLCLMVLSVQFAGNAWVVLALVAYSLWAALLLWREAQGRAHAALLRHGWIDVAWGVLLMQLTGPEKGLLVLTFILPVVMAGISQGVRQGVLLGVFGACGVLFQARGPFVAELVPSSWLTALGVLGLAPAAALLAAPLAALRRHMALADRLEAEMDPRRGLATVCLGLAERLRDETGALCTALVLPGSEGAPAAMTDRTGAAFRASPEVQRQFEAWLGALPAVPITWQSRRSRADQFILRGTHAKCDLAVIRAITDMGDLLEVKRLVIVPISYLGRARAYLIVGQPPGGARPWHASAIGQLVPALQRLIQQAALVDELQAEIAGHERARIGRDLHDSAIQPYLGLKYAVESLAAACPPSNPMHADVASLAELVQQEVGELRELISVLRTGEAGGDNALVPAVRRQVRRFQRLFGIQVHLECPAELHTSRALAEAVFHMLNEALNNVRKHTPARQVWVNLWLEARRLHLQVKDDAGTVNGRPAPDFAPRSLLQRAHELGGTLDVDHHGGPDTTVRITVPL